MEMCRSFSDLDLDPVSTIAAPALHGGHGVKVFESLAGLSCECCPKDRACMLLVPADHPGYSLPFLIAGTMH